MKSAICAIVKNEQSAIVPWIVYHKLIGFHAIILLIDRSNDLTESMAREAAALYDVRVSSFREEGTGRQTSAYLRVCRENASEFDWIAFLDADEYLVPRTGERLPNLLSRCAERSAIAVPWLMFGSSHHEHKPAGLVIEEFRQRSESSFPPNCHVKSIVRPGAVRDGINPHVFEIEGAYALPNGSPGTWASPGVLRDYPFGSPWKIHHYFTRSRAHWTDRMHRGQLGQFVRTWDDFDYYDRNEVRDDTAAAFAQPVRQVMSLLGGQAALRTA